MSSRISQHEPSAQGCEVPHDSFSPRPPAPSSANVSVSEAARKVLSDQTVPPSDDSDPIICIASDDKQASYERLAIYLLGQPHALTCDTLLQKELSPLLVSFGITDPCVEENKKQALERITTILNSLKQSTVLTEYEKAHFSVLSAEEIIQDPRLLHVFLNIADRDNLIIMISEKRSPSDFTFAKKPFPQKVEAVLNFIRRYGKNIRSLGCDSPELTNIPEEGCNLENLEKLFLHGNHLTSLPEWIGRLSSLETLSVHHNHLTSLPEWIGSLSNLRWLSVEHNHLTTLPDSLGNLSNLQSLSVHHNNLTALLDSLGNLSKLHTLSVSGNKLTALPDSLGRLSRLQCLHLAQNPLTALPEWLGQLPQLQEIFLAMNDNIQIPELLQDKIRRCEER
jgi:Leucine-rich repeat (LRR) protein